MNVRRLRLEEKPKRNLRLEERPQLNTRRARLAALLGPRKRTVVLLGVASTIGGLCEASVLALIAQIATIAAKGNGRAHQNLGILHIHAHVKTLFIFAFGFALLRTLTQAPLSVLPARISAGVSAELRRNLFDAYTHASWDIQSRDREGQLQETMTNQVQQASGGALQATGLIVSTFTFFVLLASAVALNAVAAGIVMVTSTALFLLLRPLNNLGARLSRRLSKAQVRYAKGVAEANRLAEETHVFGVGDAQRERIDGLIATSQRLGFLTNLIGRLSPSMYQSVIYLMLIGGLAILYSSGPSHFVALGAVVLIVLRAGNYGQGVQASWQGLRQSLPYIERLQNSAQRYVDSIEPDGDEPLPEIKSLALERVSFAYTPGRPVLQNISFEVDAGEAIGVIGPSGAGKSTLIQLLLQLRRPQEGRYLVNGKPIEDFRRSDWQRRVSYVPQEPRLYHATVADNIRLFREFGDEQVEQAARLARIHDDVMSWPKGYDTLVGPRADAVSGGQQQRICLARALVGRPNVLVLDEPTSALDPHSETLIGESLMGLRQELTLFIIAHRMSTLDICDRVMVIIDGRMAAFDTTQLLRTSNSYYRSALTIAAGGALP